MSPEEFLLFVRDYVAQHPQVGAKVADWAQAGLQDALGAANARAADMEAALALALAKRIKKSDSIIREKLIKWEGHTSYRWDWYTHAEDE